MKIINICEFVKMHLLFTYVLLSHSVVPNSFATHGLQPLQAPLFMGLSRQEYWSGLPFSSPSHTYNIQINVHIIMCLVAKSCLTLCDHMTCSSQASLSSTNSRSSLKLTSIESVMLSSHLILCCPLLLLPPIPPSIRVFSNESILRMRWPKYWSFSFSISPSNEHPGLISFRMDWLNLLAVQAY